MKQKYLKKLIILSSLSFSIVNAATHTEQTYLQTRPFLSNMPMEYTTWHTQTNKADPDENAWFGDFGDWGMSFQVLGFYQKSNNKENLGRYFGYTGLTENTDFYEFTEAAAGNAINVKNIIHNQTDTAALKATNKFFLRPSQETIGLRLDVNHNVDNFFTKLSIPIIQVKNSISPEVITRNPYVMSFFNGEYEETTTAANLQEKLEYSKIGNSQDRLGIGDMEIAAGYNFYKTKYNHIKAGLDLTIPISNDAKNEWLFEPITGNGGYWAIGAFIDSKINLWKAGKNNLDILIAFNAQYLLKSSEKRIVGLKDYAGYGIVPLSRYYLMGEDGKNALFPAANILAQDVRVKPGFHLEGLVGLALISDNFTFDFGYNLFYKESESLNLKHEWTEDKYALAETDFSSAGAFSVAVGGGQDTLNDTGAITAANLYLEPAETPSALTHKIYVGVGFCFNEWERPVMLGMGGGYEFHSGNTALENFEIYMKVGLSF